MTLGDDSETAAQRLRRLLVELEDNTFVAGREAKKRQLARTQIPNCDLRSLADSFLCDVRRRRGKKTATDYRNRLAHLLDFAETPDSRRRQRTSTVSSPSKPAFSSKTATSVATASRVVP